MSDCTTSSAWVKGIGEVLNAAGMDVSALFREAGIDIASVNSPGMRYATDQISLLWKLAAARSDNPAIGLAMPDVSKPASWGVLAYTMLSSENLHAGLERLVAYLRIVSDAATMALEQSDEGYWLTMTLCGGRQEVPRQRVEFNLIALISFCRWLTGRDLRPLAVETSYAAPAAMQTWADAFRCPLRFDAPVTRILFSHEDLTSPLSTSNPMLAQLHDRYASEYLERLDNAKISQKIRDLIIGKLSVGDPLRGDIASALCMSERTLQRRLQEEGASFQDLVDGIRRDLAGQYLRQQDISIEQTTSMLGFTDSSTLTRACKRWFGMSPKQYRVGSVAASHAA